MSTSVDWNKDGSCWIEIAPGRKKLFGKKHPATLAAKNRLTLDYIREAKNNKTRGGRGVTVYYRDESGKICLPPSPDLAPKGYVIHEASGPIAQDKLCREMERDLRADYGNDYMTAYMDSEQGNPRDVLARTHAMSNLERDLIGAMLEDLDKEESKRQRVNCNTYFPERERM